MRAILAIGIVCLTIGLASRPMLAQVRADIHALESIHMIDAMNGWAITRVQNRPRGEAANGLWRTTNGGTEWRDVTPPLGPQGNFFSRSATNVDVLSALFAWLGPLRTVDGGKTWKNVPAPGVIRSIHFINARDGWLLSFHGARSATVETAVYRSADGGETWTKVASSRDGPTRKSDLPDVVGGNPHITFLNATTGWITRSDPVLVPGWLFFYVTHDGGREWRWQRLPLPSQVKSPWGTGIISPKFFTARDGLLPVFYANLDPQAYPQFYRPIASFAVLYVTHDGGTTWRYTTPISVTRSDAVSFADINHGWLADEKTLYTTSDGGRRWSAIRPTAFTEVRQLDFISPLVGWAVRQSFPFLLKTMDGGRAWAPVTYTIVRQ